MKKIFYLSMIISVLMTSISNVEAGRKKIMAINMAKVLAERALVETVYGVKIKFNEKVTDIIDAQFEGSTSTKTGPRRINGVKFDEIVYDEERDIAKVTASVKIGSIIDLDEYFQSRFKNKVVRRVAFATTTKSQLPKLQALRAAEIDAYKNLLKQISGFTLESKTTVENFMLKSDEVKTAVLGAIMGAELEDYRWEGKDNDAIVILKVSTKDFEEMLPEQILDMNDEFITAEGFGASVDDLKK